MSFGEMTFLPAKDAYVVDTPEFRRVRHHLREAVDQLRQKEPERPTLRRKRTGSDCDSAANQIWGREHE